eukprot:1937803-Ditylum_brightwellii.AAC.1
MGYVIKYANCPIAWMSKLQSEIAMSTTESELLNKVRGSIRIYQDAKAEFKCKVFEDNNGCIELAKCPRIRPRTKHIGI